MHRTIHNGDPVRTARVLVSGTILDTQLSPIAIVELLSFKVSTIARGFFPALGGSVNLCTVRPAVCGAAAAQPAVRSCGFAVTLP